MSHAISQLCVLQSTTELSKTAHKPWESWRGELTGIVPLGCLSVSTHCHPTMFPSSCFPSDRSHHGHVGFRNWVWLQRGLGLQGCFWSRHLWQWRQEAGWTTGMGGNPQEHFWIVLCWPTVETIIYNTVVEGTHALLISLRESENCFGQLYSYFLVG